MCNNTLAGLNQIMDAMDEQGGAQFVRDLNMDEMRSFDELMHVARQFAKRAERAQGEAIDLNVEEILEGDE
jgi:hypothetical protein